LVIVECARLITAGRRSGAVPAGPPPRIVASALMGAVEGLVINLAGQAPWDEELAGSVVAGVLGLQPAPKRRNR
jgi:hypothetical protein